MKRWFLAVASFVILIGSLHATNGMSPIGYGVKSKGMGGVGVALPLDSFVIAVNPAGLIDLGCRADIEIGATLQKLSYQGTLEATPAPTMLGANSDHPLYWPALGLTKALNRCVSVGIASYVLGASDVRWNEPLLLLGESPEETRMQNYYVAITPGVAWCGPCNQSFGVSASVVFGSTFTAGVSQLESGSQMPAFVNDNGDDTAVGVNIRLGWLADLFCDTVRLGASIVSKTYMSRFSKYQGLIGDYGAFQWPWSATMGFAWFFNPCWTLSVDYRYIQWKSNDGMYFSEWVNQPNRGTTTRGLWDGEGFGWNNQSVAKLGLAWTPASCVTLRFGYNYNTNQIPSSEMLTAPLIGAVIRNHVTVGATVRTCFGEGSVYYAHGFRRLAKSHGGLQPADDSDTDRVHLRNEQNEVGLAWGVCY